MTLRCLRNEEKSTSEKPVFSVAHVCDQCKARGPMVGAFENELDHLEYPAFAKCDRTNNCLARQAGWSLSEETDLCPKCKPK